MKTNDRPVGLANLLAGKPATTTTKETKVSTTKKARTHKAKPVAVEAPAVAEVVEVQPTPADLTAIAVDTVKKSEGAVEDAKVLLRTACIAVFNANQAGVSFRALELASKDAGAKISKSSYARYAEAGAILIKDADADPFLVIAKVNKKAKAEKPAKPVKPAKVTAPAEGEGEGEGGDNDKPVALTLAEIVEQLTEGGASAIADVTANLIASLQDDHEVFVTLAVALLRASANTVPLDQQERAERVNLLNASADAIYDANA